MEDKEKNTTESSENEGLSSPKRVLTFTKRIILFVLILSQIEILLSYTLAFMGKENIAEALSSQVVVTCCGGLAMYCIKSLIENLSKYGNLFNKKEEAAKPLVCGATQDTNQNVDLTKKENIDNITKDSLDSEVQIKPEDLDMGTEEKDLSNLF